MCGIYASVSRIGTIYPSQELKQLLLHRGPDHLGESDVEINGSSEAVSLSFTSTVLALRGGYLAVQPLVSHLTGSTLCWNGEAWKIGQELVEGNDGEAILDLLTSRTASLSALDSVSRVLETMRSISGPFAFVYLDKVHDLLYFGRDYLGRRSLLLNVEGTTSTVQFSSVADTINGSWREVEADGIYILAVSNDLVHTSLSSMSIGYTQSACFSIFRAPESLEFSQQVPVGTLLMRNNPLLRNTD